MRHEALLGRKVAGRFTITRFLGEGGMASVFIAERDAEPRRVALKIMNPEFTADRAFVRRFQREAKAAARVKHANSVKIFEYGIEGSLSYIVMELLHGDDLYVLLEQHGAISQMRAVRILAEVCDALVVAHEMGVVHRDLKPENIMIIQDPTHPHGERVKVLDFGIAKILDSGASGEEHDARVDPMSVVTRAGTFIGTPAYMSPEQCGLMPVDTRADIYTCGVLLFQLITGRLPFEGETPLHTATLHIHAPVPTPASLAPQIDPRIEALIVKALSKKPADRHQTARHLGASLRKILADLADVAVGMGPISRRQPSSILPREALPRKPVMSPLPPLPPLPRSLPGMPLLADRPETNPEVSLESARTLVSGPEAGPPPAVLLHPTPPEPLSGVRSPAQVGMAEPEASSQPSVPEISLQLPSWSDPVGDGLARPSRAPDSSDAPREEGEDESTLTMQRPEEIPQEPIPVRVNVLSIPRPGARPAGREVKATLRSAADFGLSVPERKAEIGVVSADQRLQVAPLTPQVAPPTPQSPVLPATEGAPKRGNNTIRMTALSQQDALPPLPGNSPPLPGNSPPLPGKTMPLLGNSPPLLGNSPPLLGNSPPLPGKTTQGQAAMDVVSAPLQASSALPGSATAPSYLINGPSVQVTPNRLAQDSRAHESLGLASTMSATPVERMDFGPPPKVSSALPEVHLVRPSERWGWLAGKRGLILAFVAGMILTALMTVLLMALYLRMRAR